MNRLLLVILIVLLPLTAVAQETSDTPQAVMDAKRDAQKNINPLWYTGYITPAMGMASGVVLGFLIGGSIGLCTSESGSGCSNMLEDTLEDAVAAGYFGAGVGCLTPAILTFSYTDRNKPVPNPIALIGKSPEYVSAYTTTYQKRSNTLKRMPVIVGTAGAFPFLAYLMFFGDY